MTKNGSFIAVMVRIHLFVLCLPLIGAISALYIPVGANQYDVVRWTEIVVLISVNSMLLFKWSFAVPFMLKAHLIALILSACYSVIGPDSTFTLLATIHWVMLLGVAVSVVLFWNEKAAKFYLFILAIFGAYLTFVGGLNLVFGFLSDQPILRDVVYPFGENVRFYNQLQIFFIPVFFAYAVFEGRFRVAAWLLVACNIYLCVFLGARGLAVGLLCMAVFMAFDSRFRKPCVMLFVLFLFFYVLNEINIQTNMNSSVLRGSSSGRVTMWLATLSDMSIRDWLVGKGSYAFAFQQFRPEAHPHNIFIQILYEHGAIVAFTLLYFAVKLFRKSIVLLRAGKLGYLECGYMAGLFGSFVYANFTGIIVMPLPQVLFVIFGAVVIKLLYNPLSGFDLDCSRFVLRRCTALVALILFVGSVTLYLPAAYLSFSDHQKIPNRYHRPGFWLNGKPPWALEK